jgi:hypothetical protein
MMVTLRTFGNEESDTKEVGDIKQQKKYFFWGGGCWRGHGSYRIRLDSCVSF